MTENHGHKKHMQDLFRWLERHAVASYDLSTGTVDSRKKFFPRETVEEYFQKPNYQRTVQLLRDVFPNGGAPSYKNVADICPRIFCILATMRMNVVKYIGTFVENDSLSDARLPFENKPSRFPIVAGDEDGLFWEEFKRKQWQYCAPQLSSRHKYVIEDDQILPFTELQRAGGGGSATVYKATVHQAHDLLTASGPARNSNVYALKTYRKKANAPREYQRELEAFQRITESGTRMAHGIIEFYSSFEYRQTFNLLLQYADGGTLEDYLQKDAKPSTGADMIDLWENLFATLQALFSIHQKHLNPDESGYGKLLQGWHQDLKPENILIVNDGTSPYSCSFKIADLGLSHFKTIMEGQPEALDFDTFGTQTYGAPECYAWHDSTANRKTPVKRSIDIWSLGGVYSEVAVWAVDGPEGVNSYRRRRKRETDKLSDFRNGNCFHDGRGRLKMVDEQHHSLKRKLQPWDFITGKVVDHMIVEMLEFEPGARPTAEQLIGKAKRRVSDAREALQETTIGTPPQHILTHLASPPQSPETSPELPNAHHRSRPSTEFGQHGMIFPDSGRYFESPRHTIISSLFQGGPSVALSMQESESVSPSRDRLRIQSTSYNNTDHREGVQGLGFIDLSAPSSSAPPHCSLEQAQEWYTKMKFGDKQAKLPYEDELLWQLKNRDHVFMIDDSRTMRQYWREVEALVRVLAYITKKMDRDKLELYYLSSSKEHRFRSSADLATAVRDHPANKMTNLNTLLDADLQNYMQAIDRGRTGGTLFRRPGLVKRSIYIFSDGVWESGVEEQGYNSIKVMTEKLAHSGYSRDQIGIQLIRFGNDEAGTRRMKILDNLSKELNLEMDIVDTEPSNGNIWKMLLGAINELFDGDSRPTSPVANRMSRG